MRRGSAAEPTQSPKPGHQLPVPFLQLLALLALSTAIWHVCLFFSRPPLLRRNSPTQPGPVPAIWDLRSNLFPSDLA